MNKVKYAIVNGDTVLGMVYESTEYGRTVTIQEKIDLNHPVYLYDIEKQQKLEETDFIKFIWEMIPKGL